MTISVCTYLHSNEDKLDVTYRDYKKNNRDVE